jgi:hypothetical protein
MRKAAVGLKEVMMWVLIILTGFVIAYVLFTLLRLAAERGLPAIFGG